MTKETLKTFINKYYLGGTVESVKWVANTSNKQLITNAITEDKNVLLKVTLNNFSELPDGELGINDTSKLVKLLGVLKDEIKSEYNKTGDKITSVVFSDDNTDVQYVIADLQILDNKEVTSDAHSPIIGWAYDGNPIYGPYGYSSKTGGSIKPLESGYNLIETENRIDGPDKSIYPLGFFIEDYDYIGNGDLDEHNGRFGITPEYPNGIYAYFTTISNGLVESSGNFSKYKKPIFPYIIGSSYKSKPIDFNFSNYSNQDYIDINQTNWKRNITPYNISSYDYLFNPNSIKEQNSIVKSSYKGSIDSIEIKSAGQNYKIGDRLVFNHQSGSGAKAKVSSIKGKEVNQISVATSSFSEVEFYPYNQSFIGFTSIPHNYSNNDLVSFTGAFDYKKSGNITVNVNNLILTSGVGSAQYTGIVTYFNISGNLNYPNIKENDIYQIGSEEVKILNIDPQSSRIKVLRNQNGTTGFPVDLQWAGVRAGDSDSMPMELMSNAKHLKDFTWV